MSLIPMMRLPQATYKPSHIATATKNGPRITIKAMRGPCYLQCLKRSYFAAALMAACAAATRATGTRKAEQLT